MTKNRFNKLDWVAIPPKEINVEALKDIFKEFLEKHSECTIIRVRKKVPQNTEGLVVEVGLHNPLSEDNFNRYQVIAVDLANMIHTKITLIPTEIGIEAYPEGL